MDAALGALRDGSGELGPVVGYGVLFVVGVGVGLLSLVGYEQWMTRRATAGAAARGGADAAASVKSAAGPGAMAVTELPARRGWSAPVSPPGFVTDMVVTVGGA